MEPKLRVKQVFYWISGPRMINLHFLVLQQYKLCQAFNFAGAHSDEFA